jgi:hypothetical protein
MEPDEELMETAVARLNAKLTGLVFGLLLGFGLFLATNILVLKGGDPVGPHLGLLDQFFPGYSVTFLGSLVGFFYAFLVGYVVGAAVGFVYNKIADL